MGPQCPVCLFSTVVSELPDTPQGARAFGEYELLEELGRGGMGVVYRAWQPALQRSVALKMLLAGPFAAPEFAGRFRREALAAARVQHPGIAAIYDAGECDGQAYYTMELVEGPTAAALARDKRPSPSEAAALLEKTARAVAHAHAQGVLHRDLKPSNILITPDGSPKVADFGLARVVQDPDGTDAHTLSTSILGSPPYMAPEQAEGRNADAATDVYALGAVLYDLLTGRPPHQGSNPREVLKFVREAPVVEPRRLNPALPRDLETICLKCLERDASRRYPSAAAFADDLARFLRGEPVVARPVSVWGKLWRWGRRRPALAAALGLVLAAMVAVVVVSVVASRQMSQAASAARAAEAEARERLRLSLLSEARARVNSTEAGRQFQTVELLRRAEEIAPSPEAEALAVAALSRADVSQVQLWDWKAERGYYATVNRDLSLIALLHEDGGATLRRAASGEKVHRLGKVEGGFVEYPVLSPDAGMVAIRGKDNRLRIFRWKDGTLLLDTPCLSVSGFGGATDAEAVVVFRDGEDRMRRWTETGGTGPAWPGLKAWGTIALTAEARRVAVSVRHQPQIAFCDAQTGRLEWLVQRPDDLRDPTWLTWDPTGRWLAYTDGDHIAVFDAEERLLVSRWRMPGQWSLRLAFSPDGRSLASLGWDPRLRLFDWRRGTLELSAPTSGENISFSPDGTSLFTDLWNARQSTLWRFSRGTGLQGVTRMEPPPAGAGRARRGAVDFDPAGRYLVCAGEGGIEWRRADTGALLVTIPAADVLTAAFHPLRQELVYGTRRGLVRLPWNDKDGELKVGPAEAVWTGAPACLLRFSPDGRSAAAWSFEWQRDWAGQHLRVFDSSAWQVLYSSPPVDSEPRGPQWSLDGRFLADHAWRRAIATVYEPAQGTIVWEGDLDNSSCGPRWTPDGKLLCFGGKGTVLVDPDKWKVLGHEPARDDSWKVCAAFSSRGIMAAGGSHGEIELLTWPGRKVIGKGRTESGADAELLCFSKDGLRLAVVDTGGGVMLWSLTDTVKAAREAGLPATLAEWLPPDVGRGTEPARGGRVELVSPDLVSRVREQCARRLPARQKDTPDLCLDLAPWCQTLLTDRLPLEPGGAVEQGWDFGALTPGLQELGGRHFDVRGLIILNSSDWLPFFPDRPVACRGIPVNRRCSRLHFLLGAVSDTGGEPVATVVIHGADASQFEIPLRHGEELDCSILDEGVPPRTNGAGEVAWSSPHPALGPERRVRLYRFTWANPSPEVDVTALDFVSSMRRGGLIVAGVTVE